MNRSSLELLLLALVRDGLGSPYELKSQSELSLGSTIPALDRLEKDGLLSASKPGARKSRRFTVTPQGQRLLQNEWGELQQRSTTDLDSIVRIAYLTWMNGSAAEAATFLEGAAERLRRLGMVRNAKALGLGRVPRKVNNEDFTWLRNRIEGKRLVAEANGLVALAKELRKAALPGMSKSRKKEK